eukprot:gb/GFBE01007435.1/.p1 GENE.gb/GFBE01007435.1/~~gb/GFBE01007435.1/.p1  ORF type:complete len:137 (+),score=8.16 gb/GFBE01007435.1/:1-411(+)
MPRSRNRHKASMASQGKASSAPQSQPQAPPQAPPKSPPQFPPGNWESAPDYPRILFARACDGDLDALAKLGWLSGGAGSSQEFSGSVDLFMDPQGHPRQMQVTRVPEADFMRVGGQAGAGRPQQHAPADHPAALNP